jgi:ParB family chromosome partitioning protein
MGLTNQYKRVPVTQIAVNRDERQRRSIDTSNLLESIKRRGVLQPIIITKEFVLVAGERRLAASRELGLFDIPCRFIEDLPPLEAQIIELEENLKRSDLSWQENCSAIARIHGLYVQLSPDWTMTQTAQELGVGTPWVSMNLRVSQDMALPRIAEATSLGTAHNMLARKDERKMADAISDIMEAGSEIFEGPKAPPAERVIVDGRVVPLKPPPAPVESIQNLDFQKWAPNYAGKPFNFIHCDFPYGINVFSGPHAGRDRWTTYDDSPDVYWALIRTLCANLDRLMAPSAHLMFWFSMDYYTETLEIFRKLAPSLSFCKKPLIWLKTDNLGIIADPQRGPRHIYETCLFASREDRLIVKVASDAYGAPTNKDLHPSTKPEPVLRHFFSMFVDENSTMLDPTCGSGSSLRAAESLGAKHVFGLEIDKEHYDNARSALRNFRALRKASK